MGFNIKVEAVERISEYNGTSKEGNPYVIGSWKVKNVADNSVMLVSCFGVDDATLRNNPGLAMEATLTITCRDWVKGDKKGIMNNVNLTNIIGPNKPENAPPVSNPVNNASIFDPAANKDDLPFN